MSMIVRPAEAGWVAVVEMQKEKAESEIARGVKRLMAAAGSVPPGGDGPSNLNDLSIYSKYMKKYANDVRNKLPDIKYFNKQNLMKYLKYLA